MEKTEEDLLFTSHVLLVFIKKTHTDKVILLQIFGGRANAQTRMRTRLNPGEGTRVGVGGRRANVGEFRYRHVSGRGVVLLGALAGERLLRPARGTCLAVGSGSGSGSGFFLASLFGSLGREGAHLLLGISRGGVFRLREVIVAL